MKPRLAVTVMASLMLLGVPRMASADSLKTIFGPKFSANSHHGRHFGSRLHGQSNIEARLGVHALRRHQELQEHHRDRMAPYRQRYRLKRVNNGRSLWPNGGVALRGGPTYQGVKSTCHPVRAVKLARPGARIRISGQRCYDGYGQPHVIEESVRIIDRW